MNTARCAPTARLAGVDEAGRGPLAGPVVAAAVILHPQRPIEGLADSKLLSAAARAALSRLIMARAAAWAIAWADAAEIDALDILSATMLAMRRAVDRLAVAPAQVLVDGNRCPRLAPGLRVEAVVGGDRQVAAISAASILAKTWRDACMERLERHHPGYGFGQHKGYPTAGHREALARLGPCAAHRRSFGPVARLLEGAAA